jgi:hypothetical protein
LSAAAGAGTNTSAFGLSAAAGTNAAAFGLSAAAPGTKGSAAAGSPVCLSRLIAARRELPAFAFSSITCGGG